jgi:hypothetical protein
MSIPTDESKLDVVDLGDATLETKQVWFGQLPDSAFGLGFFRD